MLGISEKRLLGWEPSEVQEHQYEGDRLVRTVVTRDPEWDDFERAKMQALAEYEAQVCECGLHESVADQDPDLEMTMRVCPVCAGLARQTRITHAEDTKTINAAYGKDKPPPPEAELPDDGRHFALKQKAPADLVAVAGEHQPEG